MNRAPDRLGPARPPRRSGLRIRLRPGLAVAVVAACSLAACESPSVPFHPGQYDYRLFVAGAGARTFHWGRGTEVPIFVNPDNGQSRASLDRALDAAAGIWTRAATFGEVRVRRTTSLDDAVAVLQWKDAEPVLSTPPDCSGASTGAAFTRGCINPSADSLRTWLRRDGGDSRVLFSVFVEQRPDLDDALLELLVVHEVGHVLGILNHSNDRGDLMWGGVLEVDAPSGADRQTLRTLYQASVDLAY